MEKKIWKNKEGLEGKLQNIKAGVCGLKTPIDEFVCDRTGKISEEMVEEFLKELSHIRMCNNWQYQYCGISGSDKKCYESLLYLLLMSYDYNREIKTFADVLSVVEELGKDYKSLSALREDEAKECLCRPRGFFGILYDDYKELTGHSVLVDVKDEVPIVEAECRKMEAEDKLKNTMMEVCDFYKDSGIEAWFPHKEPSPWTIAGLEEPIIVSDDEQDAVFEDSSPGNKVKPRWNILTREEILEKNRDRELKYAEWKNSLENPERFLQAYKDFRKLYFISGIDGNELEDMFITFLSAKGKVGIAEDREFAALYTALDEIDRMKWNRQEFHNKFR